MIRQLSIAIENRPGRVHAVAAALKERDIDIAALSLADRETTGVLRLVVSDLAGARRACMELDLPASVTDVVAVHVSDHPGGLAAALAPLEAERLDLEYLYAFRSPGTDHAVVVMHTSDNERTERVLAESGFQAVGEVSLYG